MIWARRLGLTAGLAVASMVVVPGVAGVAGAAPNCPTTNSPTVSPSMTPPTPNCPIVVPTVQGTNTVVGPTTSGHQATTAATSTNPTTGGTSSLPFTGADVEELAIIGGAALVAGAVLMRRRRTAAA